MSSKTPLTNLLRKSNFLRRFFVENKKTTKYGSYWNDDRRCCSERSRIYRKQLSVQHAQQLRRAQETRSRSGKTPARSRYLEPSASSEDRLHNDQLKKQGHAERAFASADDAMRKYYDLTGVLMDPLPPEPQLFDYLDEDQTKAIQNGELTLIGLGMLGTGVLMYNYL